MSKKKLLSEAQVRRFMGLAGLKPINENIYEEEDMEAAEEPAMDAEEPPVGDEMDAEMDMADAEDDMSAAAPEADVGEDAIQAAVDAIADLEALVQPLADAAGISMEEAGEEMAMDADAAFGDEEVAMDAEVGLDDVGGEEEVEATEDELVMEVATRVARRILKARRAQKMLDEALGNKAKTTRTNRKK